MATRSPESSTRLDKESRHTAVQLSGWLLAVVAIAYALLAGLHTLQDFDLGWQLATGRWVVQHRHVFSTDVFSYTAAGQPWIYPVLSGVAFYLLYLTGGYALLSWLGAIACAGTVALLLCRRSLIGSALAVVAVPLIANRTQPRAEMFTTILFAAFLSLLWRHCRRGRSPLWLLPILMVAWVNLHLGFVAGLAICAAYVLLEVLDLPFPTKRQAARARLQRAGPWLALTGAATILNPWGPSLYLALIRQQRAQSLHTSWIVEWENVRLSSASLHQALDWRDPQSCFWWLMFVVLIAAIFALGRRHWGAAALLIASTYLATQHVRLQALFACVAVVVGGAMLDELLGPKPAIENAMRGDRDPSSSTHSQTHLVTAAPLFLSLPLSATSLVRLSELFSQRSYLRSAIHPARIIRDRTLLVVSRARGRLPATRKAPGQSFQHLQPRRLSHLATVPRIPRLHRWPRHPVRPATFLSRVRPERRAPRLPGMAAGSRGSRHQHHHRSFGSLPRDDTLPAAPLLLPKPVLAPRVLGRSLGKRSGAA